MGHRQHMATTRSASSLTDNNSLSLSPHPTHIHTHTHTHTPHKPHTHHTHTHTAQNTHTQHKHTHITNTHVPCGVCDLLRPAKQGMLGSDRRGNISRSDS